MLVCFDQVLTMTDVSATTNLKTTADLHQTGILAASCHAQATTQNSAADLGD